MKGGDGGFGALAQFGGELNFAPAFAVRMEDRAARNGQGEHFLQAEGLGAKLGVVVLPFPALAQLEFDREQGERRAESGEWSCGWLRDDGGALSTLRSAATEDGLRRRYAVDFHDIAFAVQAKAFGPDGQGAQQGHAFGDFVAGHIGVFVDEVAAQGMMVVFKNALDVDQRRPSRAKQVMI